jgi:ribosomal protein S18 acetylase RimI-like enzyme
MINYTDSSAGIQPKQLAGFFDGWPNPPTPETHLQILEVSSHVVLAVASDGQVVGFVTAISDGVLSAYVSLLEVRPSHRRRGIGTQLVRHLLRQLDGLYSINLHCDPELQPFYETLGMRALGGMAIRDYSAQAGRHAA